MRFIWGLGGPMNSAPNEEENNRADRRRGQRTPETEHRDFQKFGDLAADKGAADADQDIGEDAVGRFGDLARNPAGNGADQEHAEKADPGVAQKSLHVIHASLLL